MLTLLEDNNAWVERPKIVDQLKSTSTSRTTSAGDKSTALPGAMNENNSVHLSPTLADLTSAFESAKNNHKRDVQYKNKMLTVSLQHVPDLIDSEKPKIYQPRNPFNTPSYYPQQPLVIFDNPILFEKFDMDTLFYIFYYQQGTYQQ